MMNRAEWHSFPERAPKTTETVTVVDILRGQSTKIMMLSGRQNDHQSIAREQRYRKNACERVRHAVARLSITPDRAGLRESGPQKCRHRYSTQLPHRFLIMVSGTLLNTHGVIAGRIVYVRI